MTETLGSARAGPPTVHPVPTSDGTEIRLTRYRFGTKGPLVLAPGYGNAARAFALDTVPKNFVQYLGEHGYDVWLLDYRASPELPSSFDAVHRRRHRAARLAGGDRRRPPRERRRTRCRRWATASAACRCSWRIGGGMRGRALGDVLARSPATRSRRRQPGSAPGVRLATLFKALGIKGLDTDYDPKRARRQRGRDGDEGAAVPARLRQPGRAPHLLRLRRRLRLREHQPADDGAGRAELLRQRQHDVLRAHLADDPGQRRRATRDGEDAYCPTSTPTSCRSTSSPASTTGCSCPKGLQRTYDTLRRANGPEHYRTTSIKDYAHLDLWLGTNAERDVLPTALAELERHN